jgi:molybdopterin/thiamine biosynthesis adenylyltransferase
VWYFGDLDRLAAERAAISALAAEEAWFSDADWSFDAETRLCLNFTIAVGGTLYPMQMKYPRLFPATPPNVSPIDTSQRLSVHQYSNGSLCLEYRPDNWQPQITGADMIRSAHKLLAAEQSGEGPPIQVPSDHRLTLGQETRSHYWRNLTSPEWKSIVATIGEMQPLKAEARLIIHSECITAIIKEVLSAEGASLFRACAPDFGYTAKGALLRIAKDLFTKNGEVANARAFHEATFAQLGVPKESYQDREFVALTDGARTELYWQVAKDKDDLTHFAEIDVGSSNSGRLPPEYQALSSKRVGLVGCGSAGSKIATSLARSGVEKFFLIDDDILLRSNLLRHELDWREIGAHKVDGLGDRLRMINSCVETKVRRSSLSGQESAASAESALAQLAKCDLIVDATAEARAFNLTSYVSMKAKKPLIWLEVFEGGIGGLVARSRPGRDPDPQATRAGILSWCEQRNAPWVGQNLGGYDAMADDRILVADDSDVAVVAAHAARMAIDVLVAPEASIFRHSVYMIGLRKAWIFEQPFDTWPIEVEHRLTETSTELASPDARTAVKFLAKVLAKGPK